MEQTKDELKLQYEKYREIIKGLTMMSDAFMRNVLKEKECAEYVLQVIMEKKDLRIIDVTVQQDHKNLQGRSAILDCVAEDNSGNRFDIEVQQDAERAAPKRARYHSAILDANTLNPGEDFTQLPQSYVIFITRDDVLGDGFAIYHIEKTIKETRKSFGDQAYIIYVDSSVQDDTELGRLMHDFHCKNADEMYSSILADRVRNIKETQKGVDDMCQEMEKIYNEGIEKGRRAEKSENARSLFKMGLSVEKIAEALKVSVSEVKEWLSGSTRPV